MNKYFYIIMAALAVITSLPAYAQKVEVEGRITDEKGAAVVAVTVLEEGTNNAAFTDRNGNYKITVENAQSILQFSFLGYEAQRATVGNRTTINITLKELVTVTDDVVIVGYGQQDRATVVGAISTGKAEDFAKTGTTNLTQAIGGRVAGVFTKTNGGRPGDDDAEIWIRGRASYNTKDNAPLVLVDGVERDFSQIDPDDIEHFSVLKDASATAVFGVRGANGVILITTKRGKTEKPEVTFKATVTLAQPTRLPDKLGSYDYARLKNEALANVGLDAEYSDYDLEMYRTKASPYTHPDNDYFNDMMKNVSVKQQYNLSVRGGTPFVNYYVAASYLNEDGLYKTFDNDKYDTNVSYRRYALRTNLDFNVTRTTTVGVDVAGRLQDVHDNGNGNLYQSLVRNAPNLMNYINPDGSLGGSLNFVNPYAALSRNGYNHSKTNVFESVIKVTQRLDAITQGLYVKGMFGFTSSMKSRRDLVEQPALWKYNKDGSYEAVQAEKDITIRTNEGNGPHVRRFTFEASLNYDKTFNKYHKVTGLFAYNRLQRYQNQNLPTGYINYVGRVTYGYKGKYLAEINAAYNGSTQFSKDNRYGFFPAFSAGWVASSEDFWKNFTNTVNYFKIRGSYGEVGNDLIGTTKYFYLQTYNRKTNADGISMGNESSIDPKDNKPRLFEGKLGNNEVGWERAKKFNVGVEMRFFANKLKFTADFFNEKRVDILDYDMTLPYIFGVLASDNSDRGLAPLNLGKVRNRGFEFELSWDHKIGGFGYYIEGNLSFARNKILYKSEPDQTYPWTSEIGRPVGQRFGLICDGFYNSWEEIAALPSYFSANVKPGDLKYRDINGDGVIDSYDVTAIGNTGLPEIFYGFTVGGDFKGFDFQLFFQGAARSDIAVSGYGYWEFTNSASVMKHHLNRWTPETAHKAKYPSLTPYTSEQNHRVSTFWLKSGDYLRLKTVEIGYSIPKPILSKAKISNLRVYVAGTNLLTFSKFKEYDPESSDGDNTHYPQLKHYRIGVNLKF